MRRLLFIAVLVSSSCGPAAREVPKTPPEPTAEPWYAAAVNELASINREAKEDFEKGKGNEASNLIQKGEPISKRLISVPRPTLAAAEAASDLDQLYGRMLFSNKNYGWARLFFQKNLSRWKYWQPQTPETTRRMKEAQSEIAECDSRISQ